MLKAGYRYMMLIFSVADCLAIFFQMFPIQPYMAFSFPGILMSIAIFLYLAFLFTVILTLAQRNWKRVCSFPSSVQYILYCTARVVKYFLLWYIYIYYAVYGMGALQKKKILYAHLTRLKPLCPSKVLEIFLLSPFRPGLCNRNRKRPKTWRWNCRHWNMKTTMSLKSVAVWTLVEDTIMRLCWKMCAKSTATFGEQK